jgi:hypothetical protein
LHLNNSVLRDEDYGEVDVKFRQSLTLSLDGGVWSASQPCRFTTRETALSTNSKGGRVDPRASVNIMEKRKLSCPDSLVVQPTV